MDVKEELLERQLQSETRVCGECGYIVLNPLCERCPRCNRLLPKLELFCSGCLYNSICPALKRETEG